MTEEACGWLRQWGLFVQIPPVIVTSQGACILSIPGCANTQGLNVQIPKKNPKIPKKNRRIQVSPRLDVEPGAPLASGTQPHGVEPVTSSG